MRLKLFCVLTLSILQAFSARRAPAQTVTSDQNLAAQLQASDEELLKAVHTGDQAPWKALASSDFFYLDEAGGATYLDAFLRDLKRLPSKPLEIQTYKLTRAGDTAIVLHEDTDENQVRYIFTETWQRLNGAWRLRVLHITNVLSDPPAIQLSAAQIDELTGTYTSNAVTYTIRRDGAQIMAKRANNPEVEFKAETRDVFFVPNDDPRERDIFLRDPSGKVTGFIVRYESYDHLWIKVK